ncbi:hypothetical protein GCM10011584_35210 [Nocardioides phosphati]|uniref:Uncharacterized protein n=1 Tax=Nocardioides phosphati TaxID=1867775 RepID=A0ABQ2NF99_9ACTN|nr:hypothetical protein GCM10011584_35210 [Nocardioides phosphati]
MQAAYVPNRASERAKICREAAMPRVVAGSMLATGRKVSRVVAAVIRARLDGGRGVKHVVVT